MKIQVINNLKSNTILPIVKIDVSKETQIIADDLTLNTKLNEITIVLKSQVIPKEKIGIIL